MSNPQSIADVESLIQRLYRPGEQYVIIQQQLQELQRSPEGWQLGDALLSSADANVRFFGALTFTVKLNGPFDGETAIAVLERLKHWVRTLNNELPLVVNKLMTALVTYCLRTPIPWRKPHQDLITLLGGLDRLSRSQLVSLLSFSSALAEETNRMEHTLHAPLHLEMEEEILSAVELMKLGLENTKMDALHCFSMWANYAQPRWSTKSALKHLQTLTSPMMECLTEDDDQIRDEALSVFTDLLESYITLFDQDNFDLFAKIIDSTISNVPQSESQMSPQRCQLIVAYGVCIIEEVFRNPGCFNAQVVLKQMIDILQLPYVFEDGAQDLTLLCTEFWNALVEYAADNPDTDQDKMDYIKTIIYRSTELHWRKIFIPATLEYDDDFKSCRTDVADLSMMVYMVLGEETFHQLITMIVESLKRADWQGIEAAVFLLNAVADNILEYDHLDEELSTIIQPLFTIDSNNYLRRTVIDMIGEYGLFLQRRPEYIPHAVRYLFASLDTQLANTAARSIYDLCSVCRYNLTGDLNAFIEQYNTLTSPYVKEKVIGGIAAIIQALKPRESQVEPLLRLIQSVEGQGLLTLECLAAIGKGSQEPSDQISVPKDFWQEEGKIVQDRIISCFVLDNTPDVIEAICKVIHSGFTEDSGPFVFPPAVTINLLQQCTIETPQVESVLSVAALLIVQHSRPGTRRIFAEAQAILDHVASFMRALGHPSQDPSISSNCLDTLIRLLKEYFSVVQNNEALPFMLNFAIQAIEAHDLTPKRAALDLFTRILRHKESTAIVRETGPVLAQALVRQIAGVGQRSDLDSVNEPLKALFSEWPAEAKQFVETALWSNDFPIVNGKVGDVEKRRFLAQLVTLRGGAKVKEVTRDFFAVCRGVVTSYS